MRCPNGILRHACTSVLVAALSACGGGNTQTAIIGTTLYGPPSGDIAAQVNTVQFKLEQLGHAGVEVLDKRCGWWRSVDSAGSPVATVIPELFVLLEISDSDLHKALEAGFVVATAHMKSYSPIECSTYGL